MRLRRNARTFLFFTFILVSATLSAQTNRSSEGETESLSFVLLPRQSRIILLPLPEKITDRRVQQAIAEASGLPTKKKPKSSKHNSDRFSKLQTGRSKPEPLPPALTLFQQQQVARAVFRTTLLETLHGKLHVSVVPDEDAARALNALRVTPGTPLSPEKAGALAAQLGADAVLNTLGTELHLSKANLNLVLWNATLQVHGPVAAPEVTPVAALPTNNLVTCGAVKEEASLFGLQRPRSAVQRAAQAARQAAFRAVHTLRTGEVLPLCLPKVKIALLPVLAPTTADKLLFQVGGRTVQKNAVRSLPADVSELFQPDLLPLQAPSILPTYALRRTMEKTRTTPAAFWKKEDVLQIGPVQAIGKRSGADYALVACISDIELEEGQDMEGRAEAVGVLMRVSDGKILWNDRATAAIHNPLTPPHDRQTAQSAMRFALLELERRFHRYVNRFEE